MSSLFGSMSIALRSLLAQQGAVGTTTNNIANANTPGYSRQRPVLSEEDPVLVGGLLIGSGVTMSSVESIRDKILELRIQQETQQQGSMDAFVTSMGQVEALFNETAGVGLQDMLSKFFADFQALSVNPTNLPLRQAVLTSAENLAGAFRQTTSSLATVRSGLDRSVVQTVDEINQLTTQIAGLNGQIQALEGTGQDAGALVDQRNTALDQLSGLVDVAVIDSGDGGLTVTTTGGTALVAGVTSMSLETQVDPTSGMHHVYCQGTDITSTLTGGKIKGLLDARDDAIPSALSDLDNLAAGLIDSVNALHQTGYDLNGSPGQAFFTPFTQLVPGSNAGAAASISVALTDPSMVAASSDGTPGSNGVATALAGLGDQAIVAGQTAGDFYANLVSRIGNRISDASTQLEAENLVLRQLQNQRSAISGVSLDEEASALIRYQRAFEAAARVISVVDELTVTTINMVGTG